MFVNSCSEEREVHSCSRMTITTPGRRRESCSTIGPVFSMVKFLRAGGFAETKAVTQPACFPDRCDSDNPVFPGQVSSGRQDNRSTRQDRTDREEFSHHVGLPA